MGWDRREMGTKEQVQVQKQQNQCPPPAENLFDSFVLSIQMQQIWVGTQT